MRSERPGEEGRKGKRERGRKIRKAASVVFMVASLDPVFLVHECGDNAHTNAHTHTDTDMYIQRTYFISF